MEKAVEGYIKNGEIFLFEDIKMKSGKVRIIFEEENDEDVEITDDFLLKNRLKVRTRNFRFNRDEIYDRKSLS